MSIRDYLNPDYPPALCDEAERADRLAHFAQNAPVPAPDSTPHGAAILVIAALVALAAIVMAALGVV